jgi:hypothetical protein
MPSTRIVYLPGAPANGIHCTCDVCGRGQPRQAYPDGRRVAKRPHSPTRATALTLPG